MTEPLFTTQDQAIDVATEFFDHCMDTFLKKNDGYADAVHTQDVLRNFRAGAAKYGITMHQYASIMRGKHETHWDTFVSGGVISDKPWRILKDRIVYSIIEYLIALDNELWNHDEVKADVEEGN